MDVSVVTRLVAKRTQLKLRPEIPAPGPSNVPASRFPSRDSLRLINLLRTLESGSWCVPGGWSNRMQPQVGSSPMPLRKATFPRALRPVGGGAAVLPGAFPLPQGRGGSGEGWQALGRGGKAISWPWGPSAGNDPISIRGCTQSLPMLQSAPGAPIRGGSSSRLCNGEWVM